MPIKTLIPEAPGQQVLIPGQPGAIGGPGGPAPPSSGASWEIKVLQAPQYYVTLAWVPSRMWNSFSFSRMLNSQSNGTQGSGTLVLNLDDAWWTTTTLPGNFPAHYLLDAEHLWQVYQDGILRFEFLGETITEQLVDPSEQRLVTITGPDTSQVLSWADAMPPGFPNTIVYKTDALTDSFSEINAQGNYVINTGLWNASSANNIAINPAGSAQITGTAGGTVLGSTVWDATNSLMSAQVSPIVSPDANNVNLNGTQLTQMYMEDVSGTGYYVLIGLSSNALYAQYKGPDGTFTQVIASATAYATTQSSTGGYSYWQISEKQGTFYFWVSADGQNWQKVWTKQRQWNASTVGVYFAASYNGTPNEFATITALNSNVVTSSLGGATYLGLPIMNIWLQTLQAAQARGTIPFVTTRFTGGTDSFGNPWTDTNSVQVQNGTDLYSLLQGQAAMIDADWIMNPNFTLVVGIPSATTPNAGQVTLGYDRSNSIRFYEAGGETSKQRMRVRNQIQNLIAAINADGRTVTDTNSTSVATWGQREAWIQAAAQVTQQDISIVANAAALANANEILSWTLQITPNLPGRTVFRDFDVGDWVGLERPDFSATDVVRVVGITVQVDQDGLETHELILSSYIQWLQQRLTYIQNKMGGGYVTAAGTTAVANNAQGDTLQAPTVFNPTLGTLGLPGGAGGVPMVYNPTTGQWVPAGSSDPVSGQIVALTVPGANGQAVVSGGAISLTVPTSGTPLNTNPDFTSGSLTGWTGVNGTLTTTGSPAGGCPTPFAASMAPSSSSGVLISASTPNAAVGAGLPYTLYAWVNLPTQTDMGIDTSVTWYNSKGVQISTSSTDTVIPAGQWVQLAYQVTAPAGAVKAKIAIGQNTGVTGNSLQATDIKLVAGPVSGSNQSSVVVTPTGTVITDQSGTTRVTTGQQTDGTVTTVETNGPAPLAPDTPIVLATMLGINVIWDGQLGGSPPLSDFYQVQVHMSTTNGFTPSSATLQGTMTAPSNLTITQLTAGTTYYVVLVAVNRSGTVSPASTQVSAIAQSVSQNIPAGAISASQVSFRAGGILVTLGPTAPSSPNTGDLWYDANNGYELKQWTGSAWQPYQFGTNAISAGSVTAALIAANTITAAQIASGTITTNQIAASTITGGNIAAGTITASNIQAGTITAALLAAGIVVAGIINGTTVNAATINGSTFNGPDFVLNTSGMFIYSGTPASGNLIYSAAAVAGTDAHGNGYLAGIAQYGASGNGVVQVYQGVINLAASAAQMTAGQQAIVGTSNVGALLLNSGTTGSGDNEAQVSLLSLNNSPLNYPVVKIDDVGGNGVALQLTAAGLNNPGNPQAGSGLYWVDSNYRPTHTTPRGSTGRISSSYGYSATGNTNATTSLNSLTPSYGIAALDASTGTVYRITCGGHGTQATGSQQSLIWQVFAYGLAWGNSSALNFTAVGASFHWRFQGELYVSSGGTAQNAAFTGLMQMSQATANTGNYAPVAADTQRNAAIDTTSATSIAFQAGWSSITGSPSITCTSSLFERLGG